MRKVLIILYYWPPSGGGGVQRWLQFSKYLPDYGWEPVIYAPENADYPLLDPSLTDRVPSELKVIKYPIREIRRTFRAVMGSKKESGNSEADNLFYIPPSQRSWKQNLSLWIRGNLFIPDARVSWVKPSIRFLKKHLADHPVDAIISTGPPHSLHLIGKEVAGHFSLPWIADFRDPWTNIEFYDKLMLTTLADRRHRKLEAEVLKKVDTVISASYSWAKDFANAGARHAVTITNGFDPEGFETTPPPLHSRFLISHIGTLANDRNPKALWKALEALCRDNPEFRKDLLLRVVGPLGSEVHQSLLEAGLRENLELSPYVPHVEAIRMMRESHILLLLINKAGFNAPGRIPGKLFEYLAAERPVLLIGPRDGDSARILSEADGGSCFGYDQESEIKNYLSSEFLAFRKNGPQGSTDSFLKYSRKTLTGELAQVLEDVLSRDRTR